MSSFYQPPPDVDTARAYGRRRLTAREYEALHHLTELPRSIDKWKTKSFSISTFEEALQFKIQQHTSRDNDRVRQALKIFQIHANRARDDEDAATQTISREEFAHALSLLGLYATSEQANLLFDHYDTQKRGVLTIHDILTKNRPRDYTDSSRWTYGNIETEYIEPRGKKQFLSTRLQGYPQRPITPSDDVFHMNFDRICSLLRNKISNRFPVGATVSRPRARRELIKIFEYMDGNHTGVITSTAFRRVLDTLNLPLAHAHCDAIINRFGGGSGGGDNLVYMRLVDAVYPLENEQVSTSMYLGQEVRRERDRESRSRGSITERKCEDEEKELNMSGYGHGNSMYGSPGGYDRAPVYGLNDSPSSSSSSSASPGGMALGLGLSYVPHSRKLAPLTDRELRGSRSGALAAGVNNSNSNSNIYSAMEWTGSGAPLPPPPRSARGNRASSVNECRPASSSSSGHGQEWLAPGLTARRTRSSGGQR